MTKWTILTRCPWCLCLWTRRNGLMDAAFAYCVISASVVVMDAPAVGFLSRLGPLVGQHALLRAARAATLLAADALGLLLARALPSQARLLDLVGQHGPREQ